MVYRLLWNVDKNRYNRVFAKINIQLCIGCELCAKLCPNNALLMVNNLPIIANPKACDYAGACQEICPTEAISLTYEFSF